MTPLKKPLVYERLYVYILLYTDVFRFKYMFNVSISECFSVLNMSIVCIRDTARSKSIPLMCTHVDPYKFSIVHPPRTNHTESPNNQHKTLMKNIHHMTIKYLTYLVLNNMKLDNKQTLVPRLNKMKQHDTTPELTSQRWHNTLYYITGHRDQYKVNGLIFMPVFNTSVIFTFIFFAISILR